MKQTNPVASAQECAAQPVASAQECAAQEVVLRIPSAVDGPALHELIAACPPLDQNSRYCNLLQVSYFARTAVVAELDGEIVGSITGFIKPDDPATLFIWQVAVHERARGRAL